MMMMDEERIVKLIDQAIRQHELRVALISGVIGLCLLVGTWHSIWLLNHV